MNRLNGLKYNNKLWEVKRNNQKECNILDKKNNVSYFLKGNIVAVEQISDYDFLILEKADDSSYFLYYTLEYGVAFSCYEKPFNSIDFISDNLVLFDKDCSTATVFSISNHIECKENIFYIVTRPAVDSLEFCSSYHTELIFDDDANSKYPKYLLVNYKLLSFRKEEYIQVLVDVQTWKAISPVYSTSRGEFIEISKDKKLLEIFNEDNYKLEQINKDESYKKASSSKNLLKTVDDFIALLKK